MAPQTVRRPLDKGGTELVAGQEFVGGDGDAADTRDDRSVADDRLSCRQQCKEQRHHAQLSFDACGRHAFDERPLKEAVADDDRQCEQRRGREL